MMKYDVYANPGQQSRIIPYVVVVQSRYLEASERRVVVPLVHKNEFGRVHSATLNPTFFVQQHEVVMQPLEIVSIPKARLQTLVTSLADYSTEITNALDLLLAPN